ncbi:hypothetical protein IJ384_04470 [bacterium]|nr:hypothetical protein [bacterium]
MSTTIKLLPNKVWPKLKNNYLIVGNSLGHDLSIRHGKLTHVDNAKMVTGLGPCVGLAITSPKQHFVAHSAPEIDTDMNFVSRFLEDVLGKIRYKLNKQDEEISAVIYGGDDRSWDLVNTMADVFESENITPTIIAGQKNDSTENRIDSYVRNGHITLWSKLIDKINLTKDATQEQIKNKLEEIFNCVEIPEGTELRVLDKLPNKVN